MKKYLCLSLGLLMSAPILQCSSAQVSKGVQRADAQTIDNMWQEGGSLALFPLGITSTDEAPIQPTASAAAQTLYGNRDLIAELSQFGEKDLKKLKVGEKPLAEFLATKLPYKNFDDAKADAWSFNEANTFKRGEIVLIQRSDNSIGYGVICIKFNNKYIVQIAPGKTKSSSVEFTGKKITMASI